jgi:hypothetical protein
MIFCGTKKATKNIRWQWTKLRVTGYFCVQEIARCSSEEVAGRAVASASRWRTSPVASSPDLTPSDFWLRFAITKGIKSNATAKPRKIPKEAFRRGFQQRQGPGQVAPYVLPLQCNTTIPRTFWLPIVFQECIYPKVTIPLPRTNQTARSFLLLHAFLSFYTERGYTIESLEYNKTTHSIAHVQVSAGTFAGLCDPRPSCPYPSESMKTPRTGISVRFTSDTIHRTLAASWLCCRCLWLCSSDWSWGLLYQNPRLSQGDQLLPVVCNEVAAHLHVPDPLHVSLASTNHSIDTRPVECTAGRWGGGIENFPSSSRSRYSNYGLELWLEKFC